MTRPSRHLAPRAVAAALPSAMRRVLLPVLLPVLALSLAACDARPAGGTTPGKSGSTADALLARARERLDSLAATDSLLVTRAFTARPRGRAIPALRSDWSPETERVARATVFAPATQAWYVGGVRAGRLLVDIGRVDLPTKDDAARVAVVREVAASSAPVARGARLRLRGPWGATVVRVSGYDVWNGRVVATLDLPDALDSLVQATPALVVAAELLDDAAADATGTAAIAGGGRTAPPAAGACVRDAVDAALLLRADAVRDSVEQALRATTMPKLERLARGVRAHGARVPGCFGDGRLLLVVSLRAGNGEYAQERALLLDAAGRVTPLAMRDLRFKVHDELRALDADGDGIDDVSAKAQGRTSSGTVVLRLDPATRRLERLASGFAWERQ